MFFIPFKKSYSNHSVYAVESIAQDLAFESYEKCTKWMTPFGLRFTDGTKKIIDCAASALNFEN